MQSMVSYDWFLLILASFKTPGKRLYAVLCFLDAVRSVPLRVDVTELQREVGCLLVLGLIFLESRILVIFFPLILFYTKKIRLNLTITCACGVKCPIENTHIIARPGQLECLSHQTLFILASFKNQPPPSLLTPGAHSPSSCSD